MLQAIMFGKVATMSQQIIHRIKKNSQLLSPAQCQDINETGNSNNHMIAQKMKMQVLIKM